VRDRPTNVKSEKKVEGSIGPDGTRKQVAANRAAKSTTKWPRSPHLGRHGGIVRRKTGVDQSSKKRWQAKEQNGTKS